VLHFVINEEALTSFYDLHNFNFEDLDSQPTSSLIAAFFFFMRCLSHRPVCTILYIKSMAQDFPLHGALVPPIEFISSWFLSTPWDWSPHWVIHVRRFYRRIFLSWYRQNSRKYCISSFIERSRVWLSRNYGSQTAMFTQWTQEWCIHKRKLRTLKL
jgi:hypothetical protein